MEKNCPLRAQRCGGCPLLEMDYAAQLVQKQRLAENLLGRFAPVEPIRGMAEPWHYRNKVISTFAADRRGRLCSGIYAAGSHRVLPVESCLLEDAVLDTVVDCVRAAARSCRYEPFDEDRGTGMVRHVLCRRGFATGEVLVALVTAEAVLPGAQNFVRALRAEAERRGVPVTTVVQNVNPRQTSAVLGVQERVLYGRGYILDTLCGHTFAISPRSFYQVNPVQTEVLYGLAVRAAGLTGREQVLDAYCGIGTIALTAAPGAAAVTGVELNPEAVHDAIGNARHNRIANARFYAGDAAQWIGAAAAEGYRADVIFLDPPRAGASEVFLRSAARMAPRRIVYISCEPRTQARDLGLLTQLGYRAERVWPVDMFPHTEHVETVCLLSREK